MDPETRELLEESIELSRENNKMLRKMRRSMAWGFVFKILYVLVITGAAVGAYYVFQPFFDSVRELYGSLVSGLQGVGALGETIPNLEFLGGGER